MKDCPCYERDLLLNFLLNPLQRSSQAWCLTDKHSCLNTLPISSHRHALLLDFRSLLGSGRLLLRIESLSSSGGTPWISNETLKMKWTSQPKAPI